MNMKRLPLLLVALLITSLSNSQSGTQSDSLMMRSIFDKALLDGKSYDWLDHLSNEIGGRLSGSIQAEKAVRYTEKELKKRNRIRSVKVVVAAFMVPGIFSYSVDDPSAALASLWIMPMILAPFMACWLCTLQRRDSEARQLVDELYEIASLDERKSLVKETA